MAKIDKNVGGSEAIFTGVAGKNATTEAGPDADIAAGIDDLTAQLSAAGVEMEAVTPVGDALRKIAMDDPAKLAGVEAGIGDVIAEASSYPAETRVSALVSGVRSVLLGASVLILGGAVLVAKVDLPEGMKAIRGSDDVVLTTGKPKSRQGGQGGHTGHGGSGGSGGQISDGQGGNLGCDPMDPDEMPAGTPPEIKGVEGTCILQVSVGGKNSYALKLQGAAILMDPKNHYEVEVVSGAVRGVSGSVTPKITARYGKNSVSAESTEAGDVIIDAKTPGVVIIINKTEDGSTGETLVEAHYDTDTETAVLSQPPNDWAEVHLEIGAEEDLDAGSTYDAGADAGTAVVKFDAGVTLHKNESSGCTIKLAGPSTNKPMLMAIIAALIALQQRRRKGIAA